MMLLTGVPMIVAILKSDQLPGRVGGNRRSKLIAGRLGDRRLDRRQRLRLVERLRRRENNRRGKISKLIGIRPPGDVKWDRKVPFAIDDNLPSLNPDNHFSTSTMNPLQATMFDTLAVPHFAVSCSVCVVVVLIVAAVPAESSQNIEPG